MIIVIEKCSNCGRNVINLNVSIGQIKYYERFIASNPVICNECGSNSLDWWFGLLKENNLTVHVVKRYRY